MENINISFFNFLNGFAGHSAFYDYLIVFFADYLTYALILIFLAYVLIKEAGLMKKITLCVSAAFSTSFGLLLFVPVIRFFYHHPRPFVKLNDVHLLFSETGYSFPSAHAIFFFALSTAIYYENKRLGLLFFILSSILVVARVISGVHYPLDILGGAVLGIVSGIMGDSLAKKYFVRRL